MLTADKAHVKATLRKKELFEKELLETRERLYSYIKNVVDCGGFDAWTGCDTATYKILKQEFQSLGYKVSSRKRGWGQVAGINVSW